MQLTLSVLLDRVVPGDNLPFRSTTALCYPMLCDLVSEPSP
jgi:hypothetical protein